MHDLTQYYYFVFSVVINFFCCFKMSVDIKYCHDLSVLSYFSTLIALVDHCMGFVSI